MVWEWDKKDEIKENDSVEKKNGRVLGLITATNVSRFLMRRKIWNTILFILEEFENPPIYDNLRLIYIYIYTSVLLNDIRMWHL